jgi:hypothetical protein
MRPFVKKGGLSIEIFWADELIMSNGWQGIYRWKPGNDARLALAAGKASWRRKKLITNPGR